MEFLNKNGQHVNFLDGFRDLRGETFSNVELKDIDLSHVPLIKTQFNWCDFNGVIVDLSRLSSAIFEGCKFINSKISRSKAYSSKFTETIFEDCDFSNTDFSNSVFQDCKFIDCEFGWADLDEVAFYDCEINKTSFHNSSVRNTDFSGSTLNEVDFSFVADWATANFLRAKKFQVINPDTGFFGSNEQEYWDRRHRMDLF